MQISTPPPEIAHAGLRALRVVAAADGELHPLERELLVAVQQHILHTDVDVDALVGLTPADLAAAVPPGPFRERIIKGCVIMSLIDGDASEAGNAIVTAFADGLEVKETSLRALENLCKGNLRLVRLDVARRFLAADRAKKEYRDKGLRGIAAVARTMIAGSDATLAAKYNALGDLPDGTLGREYLRFIRDNKFSVPGEKGAAVELIIMHDCTHVLAGYGTDPEDESQIAAFHAGHRNEDPFGMILFSLMQFHLGVQITPSAGGMGGFVKPDLLLRAFLRGTKVDQDIGTTWDPREDFETPVEELRKRFNIVPR